MEYNSVEKEAVFPARKRKILILKMPKERCRTTAGFTYLYKFGCTIDKKSFNYITVLKDAVLLQLEEYEKLRPRIRFLKS